MVVRFDLLVKGTPQGYTAQGSDDQLM